MIKKYPSPRRSVLNYQQEEEQPEEEDGTEDYPVHLFLSREGYFKKITPLSLRMGGEQKYKENDGPGQAFETTNRAELLFFTDRQQVYKARAAWILRTPRPLSWGYTSPPTWAWTRGRR